MKNVILITIDALRYSNLGCYGYSKSTSPFIDKLSKEGIRFENAFSTAPFTPASFPSILAGMYSLRTNNYILPKDSLLISTVLQKNNYKTAAFHSNAFLTKYYGYNKGFDVFQDYLISEKTDKNKQINIIKKKISHTLKNNKFLFGLLEKITLKKNTYKLPYKRAEIITKDAINFLKKEGNKFVWIHYMDVHDPWVPKNKYKKQFSKLNKKEVFNLNFKVRKASNNQYKLKNKELKQIEQLYDAELRYVDEHIKKLILFLKKENVFKKTLIIITSDHEEEFCEKGDVRHKSKLYDVNVKVPLIIINLKEKVDENNLVSLIDLPRTILDYLKIEPPKKWLGKSILKEKRKKVIMQSFHNKNRTQYNKRFNKNRFIIEAIRTKKWKYILGELKGEELYNLLEDPNEENNLANHNKLKKIKNDLKKKLAEYSLKEKSKIKDIIKGINLNKT